MCGKQVQTSASTLFIWTPTTSACCEIDSLMMGEGRRGRKRGRECLRRGDSTSPLPSVQLQNTSKRSSFAEGKEWGEKGLPPKVTALKLLKLCYSW